LTPSGKELGHEEVALHGRADCVRAEAGEHARDLGLADHILLWSWGLRQTRRGSNMSLLPFAGLSKRSNLPASLARTCRRPAGTTRYNVFSRSARSAARRSLPASSRTRSRVNSTVRGRFSPLSFASAGARKAMPSTGSGWSASSSTIA